jgi:hypothetical protein
MPRGPGSLNPLTGTSTSGLFPSTSIADQVQANTQELQRRRQNLARINQQLPSVRNGAWTEDENGNLAAGYSAALDPNR